jgi:hypothetical protein
VSVCVCGWVYNYEIETLIVDLHGPRPRPASMCKNSNCKRKR